MPESGEASPLARTLSFAFPLTWETALVGAMLVLAAITRLWALGARVMSHDESLHVYYSWQLANGDGFAHNPMMHGPFLFEATALMNVLFGVSDFTSRLVPAILGTFIAIAVPQLLKRWLGRLGALAATALLLISPYILYYSRYIRHDIQVIAWTLLAIVAIFRFLETRRFQDLVLLAAALALMFSTMEITFFYLAIFAGFLALRVVIRHRLALRAIRQSAEFDLLVVIGTLGAFFSAPIALLLLNPIWSRVSGAPFVALEVLDSQDLGWTIGQDGLRLWGLLVVFVFASLGTGLLWGGRRWLKLAALFLGITTTLFTTFWTNPAGLGTGFVGSLGYWLSQQDVSRGSQPWYYYLIVFPIYEYLPLVGGMAAAVYYAIKYRALSLASRSFPPFLFLWTAGIFAGLSLAGEKMPWLSTHIAVPLILLTGWWTGQLLEGAWSWGKGFKDLIRTTASGLALTGVAILFLLTLRTSLAVNYVNYDYSTELIDYARGAPGVKWVLSDLQAIANHTGAGRDLKIAYDNEVSWPMSWYLRDFPNRILYGEQPDRQAMSAPVVIAGPKNWSKVESILGNRYHRFEVIRMWWPLEDYKNLSWERVRFALADPEMRSALWDILWRRDYTRYAALTGQAIDPPVSWPLSDRMRVYVQKEVAAQMLGLSLGESMLEDLPEAVDAYEGVRKQMSAEKLVAPGLNAPRNLAIGPDGLIYVVDTGNSRVVKLNPEGEQVAAWGSRTPDGQTPPAPGTFNEPWGVAVDGKGNVYVADTWNHRVQTFDADGTFLREWGTAGQAGQGSETALWGPRGIAVSPDGRVYLTDTGNKRVLVFEPDGKFLFEFGREGEGRLDEPVGVAVGPDLNVYVADTWNSRVAVFSPEGMFLDSWPVEGWLGDSLDNKPYLAVDGEGRIYVTDPEGYRVIVFSNTGEPLAAFGQSGAEEDAFGLPTGVAIGLDGGVWVADAGNNRLEKYPGWQR
ncbi:MAG TPA: flippase activity-associated protein Agl23 [Anaerolineales bacterium]